MKKNIDHMKMNECAYIYDKIDGVIVKVQKIWYISILKLRQRALIMIA